MRKVSLACALAALAACRTKSQVAREEQRALDKSVSEAQDRIHALKMLEISSGALSEVENSERAKLELQAAEDQNGGDTPEAMRASLTPPAEAPPPAPAAPQ